MPTSVTKLTGNSVRAHNLAQSQSVDAYTAIRKRGGKLRRAVRSIEKLNNQAHDKKAILDRVEKWIPNELRDAKVAIMHMALNKQLRDQVRSHDERSDELQMRSPLPSLLNSNI